MQVSSGYTDEDRFRALVSVTNTLIWVLSADGQIVEEQPGLQAFTGLSFGELAGEGWKRCLHPDDQGRVLGEWNEFQQRQAPVEIHFRLRRHDGVYRRMRARAVPMFDEHGNVREWVGANEDLTDSEQATAALRDREARLWQFAESLPQIAWEIAVDGQTVWMNQRFYEYTGMAQGAGLGMGWLPVIHAEDADRFLREWEAALAVGEPFRLEVRLVRYDGEPRWFHVVNTPQRTESGEIYRWFGTATDVDDTHRATEKIHRFLATLAHELRNPLAPICNSAQILKIDRSAPEVRRAALETIDRQAGHMVRLLDDLMDLNRVRSDRLVLRKAPLSLQAAIETALDTSRPLIEQGRHPVRLDLPRESLVVDADVTRLTQVLANVFNNAAKFSDEGQPIDVRVWAQDQQARIEIHDHGIGMSAEMLACAFDMFSQAESGVERSYGGLGIGLNVAKRLVELHGGRIGIHSQGLGSGTRVQIDLPLSRLELPAKTDDDAGDAASPCRRVLVVDDNEDAARIVSILVEFLGHRVRVAHDGMTALQIGAEFRPDVMVLDIGMPGMSGYEVAARTRETAWGVGLTLVALSGWGQESDRRRSLDAGFDHHLVKPAGVAALRSILSAPGAAAMAVA